LGQSGDESGLGRRVSQALCWGLCIRTGPLG
jgi:hypothetical protein